MNPPIDPESLAFTPSNYEICIEGRLGPHAAVWFEDMTLTVNEQTSPPQTVIRGYFVDQAALYGLISRARDLGLTLLSVKQLDETGNIKPQDLPGDADDDIEDNPSAEDI